MARQDRLMARCPARDPSPLHDPAGRSVLFSFDMWEARWPPGSGYGSQWVLAGLWHLQLWHPRRRVSALWFHGSRWLDAVDLDLPEAGRFVVESPAALARLLQDHAVEPPPLDRVSRLAAAGFARAITALGERALRAMVGPVEQPLGAGS